MKKLKFIDKLRAAFKNRDEAEHEKALEEATKDASEEETEEEKKKKAEEKETKDALSKALDAINGLTKRVTDLEAKKDDEDEEEEATEDGKKKKKAKDSAELRDEHIDVLARAEILAPGIHVPTFDAASDPQKTRDAMCGLRLKALQAAQEGKFKDTVEMLVGKGRDLKSLTCDAVASAFVATSEIVRRENNAQQTRTSTGDNKQPNIASSIADMNQRNAAFWANRK